MNSAAITNLYENCRELLLYQMEHYRSDFQNDYKCKSPAEKGILNEIDESIKTITADIFLLSEFLSNILYAENEEELFIALKSYKEG